MYKEVEEINNEWTRYSNISKVVKELILYKTTLEKIRDLPWYRTDEANYLAAKALDEGDTEYGNE